MLIVLVLLACRHAVPEIGLLHLLLDLCHVLAKCPVSLTVKVELVELLAETANLYQDRTVRVVESRNGGSGERIPRKLATSCEQLLGSDDLRSNPRTYG